VVPRNRAAQVCTNISGPTVWFFNISAGIPIFNSAGGINSGTIFVSRLKWTFSAAAARATAFGFILPGPVL